MPTGRVVIRTSWRSTLAALAGTLVILVILMGLLALWDTPDVGPGLLLVFILLPIVSRYLNRVVLTVEGLAFGQLGRQFIPWNHIGSVERVGPIGNRGLAVFDVHENRRRRLPAPAGPAGRDELADAKAVIEQWWMAYRDAAPTPVE